MAAANSVIDRTVAAIREAIAPPARLLNDGERSVVAAEIYDAGRLTPTYGFMLFSACGIAALGLLQSSVAVIIGAMLISPLMGPIMAMGMALARLDARAFRSAAATLGIGALLSIAASILIVWISPLKDATPEILARTRPTLLDLIVALLSGFVGAYLTVNRKGGAIAGVAIATALMPPLAVVGYGLATANWQVAWGSSLLFLTNVVSILGAVYGVSRRYGFRPITREGGAWETWALIGVILLLCVPLGISLRSIVIEARDTTLARSALTEAFADSAPHIAELKVDKTEGGAKLVQAVVVTRRYVPDAAAAVARQLGDGCQIEIEQIVTATGAPNLTAASGSLGARPVPLANLTGPEQRLRAMLAPLGQIQRLESADGVVSVDFSMPQSELPDYLAVEQAAQRFLPHSTLRLAPPLTPLADVDFARNSSELSPAAARAMEINAWALKRWQVPSVTVTGVAANDRAAETKLAEARAEAVALGLRARGIVDVQMAPTAVDDEGDQVRIKMAPRLGGD